MVSRRDFARFGAGAAAFGGAAVGGLVAASAPALAQAQAPAASESGWDRVLKSKKLRIAAVAGGEPYYHKDLASGKWTGFCIDMAKDLAEQLEVELEILESTWGNAILDLQSNKIDVMFGVNPTPKRALVIDFSKPLLNNSFSILAKKGFEAKTWDDLNKPEVKIAVDIGSSHDAIARRMAPKANIIGFKTADEATLAVQSGRADCQVLVVILSLVATKKNPGLGRVIMLTPVLSSFTTAGVRQESDKRLRDFVSNWADYNRGLGQIRSWVIANFALVGVEASDIPPEVQF